MEDQLEDIECSSGNVTIDTKMWRDVIRKMKSWKAPGQDAVHAFWWKIFPCAQGMLRDLIEQSLPQLPTSIASIHQSTVEHLQWMRGTHCSSLLAEAEEAVQDLGMDLSLEKEQVQTVGSKKLAKIAAQAQQKQLMDVLQAKTIHEVIMKTGRRTTQDYGTSVCQLIGG